MGEKVEVHEVDDIMLPGFRFHPTDEELVAYYLRRKIQRLPLPLELIKQLDIYKFDPWDLPKFAASREREWYFYCPRYRKYRNSTRPNRVTVAGFWKATGTDKPIYSSDGVQCIGLKKSLVFYQGRAARGLKTNWMMHEFRLPSLPDSIYSIKVTEKTPLPNDSWAICRIFKKTNSQRQGASAASPLPEATASDELHRSPHQLQFRTENFPLSSNLPSFSAMTMSSHENLNLPQSKTTRYSDSFAFAPTVPYEGPPEAQEANGFSVSFSEKVGGALKVCEDDEGCKVKDQREEVGSDGFPVSLQSNDDAWKPSSSLPFDLTKFLVEVSASDSFDIFSPLCQTEDSLP